MEGALAAPRVSWDRVHNRLLALPGSQQMALVNGGTIPDTGQYAAYTGNGVRIGELDEEFIYERRVGDTFLLGTNAWRAGAHRGGPRDRARRPRARRPWCRSGAARARPQLRPGQGHGGFLRELVERLDQPDASTGWSASSSSTATRPATCRITSAGKSLAAGCLPTDQDAARSRRRAISSATGR